MTDRSPAYIDAGDVRTVDVDGGAATVVAAHATDPSWSPDGGRLSVIDQRETRSNGLIYNRASVLDASGARRTVVHLPTALDSYVVSWAPVGDRLAVLVGRDIGLPR